ncbi:LysR family transcriptional regulator [Ramlibacter rhizophilus]|nr:LysR family transcriptional regulator [Ramlibacter rhizophilus]
MHSPPDYDWDDLRHFLAVARHGSTLAAAPVLGVDPSTVNRRVRELEKRLQAVLFRREPSGYTLTELGRSLLPCAEQVEQAAQAVTQHLGAWARSLAGVVRLTCPEPMVPRLTQSGLLDRFHARHPAIRVEFVVSDRYLSLARGDVDVALRSGDTEEADVVGRKIADSLWAVYASRDYVARQGRPESVQALAGHALVSLDDSMASHRAAVWLRQVAPAGQVVARNNSVLGLLYAVKSGIGIAPLPTALGDAEPQLVRVLGPVPELTRIWRILAHRDMRRTPAVAAFFDFMLDELPQLRPIFTG